MILALQASKRAILESALFAYFLIEVIPKIELKIIAALAYSTVFIPTMQQVFYPITNERTLGGITLSIGKMFVRFVRVLLLFGHFGLFVYCLGV